MNVGSARLNGLDSELDPELDLRTRAKPVNRAPCQTLRDLLPWNLPAGLHPHTSQAA